MNTLQPYKRTVSLQFIFSALLFLTVLFFSGSSISAADFISVKFMNNEIGFVTGKLGYLAKTTDGGVTWNTITTQTQDDIMDVCILGEDVVIIGCSTGKIMKTVDCGQNWEEKISGLNGCVKSLYLTYDNNLIACGDNGTLLLSFNHGETWEYPVLNQTLHLNKIYFYNNVMGYIAGSNSTILMTDDGGLTWTPKVLGQLRANFRSIHMIDDKMGTVVGDNGIILNTRNGWMTWKHYEGPTEKQPITDIKYFNDSDAVATGSNFIIKSTNMGRDWFYTTIPLLSSENKLNSIFMLSESKGMIVGSNSVKLATTDEGETWSYIELHSQSGLRPANNKGSVNTLIENIPTEFTLSQNYPNPFNPNTVISYSIPQNANVTLKVYDIAGKEVSELVNSYQTAGSYNINFNASNLSSGIYFYTVTSVVNNTISVKTMKMILTK